MLPIDKTYLKTNLNNWKTLILDPAYIIQKATLPTATAQNLGVIYQYIGNASGLTKGGFYECQVVAGSDPTEYAWVEISTKTLTDNDTIQTNLQKQIYVPDATSSQKGVIKIGHGLQTDNVSGQTGVVGYLEEADELPTATAALEGKIYLLTDAQTGYDRGGIYMCEESTETAGTYEWKLISMSPLEAGKGITIEDDVISADTNLFSGTKAEYEALTEAEKKKYDYLASPESEADTAIVLQDFTPTDVIDNIPLLYAKWSKQGHMVYLQVAFAEAVTLDDTTTKTLFNLPSNVPKPTIEVRFVANGVTSKDKPLAAYITTDGLCRANCMEGFSGYVRPCINAVYFVND